MKDPCRTCIQPLDVQTIDFESVISRSFLLEGHALCFDGSWIENGKEKKEEKKTDDSLSQQIVCAFCSFIDPVSAFAPIRVACLTSDFLFWSFKKKNTKR